MPFGAVAFPSPSPKFGLLFLSSDSDQFQHSGFGFGSVPPGQVRIRIGSAGPRSDSDRIRLRRFGFGSDTGSVRILHPNPGLDCHALVYSSWISAFTTHSGATLVKGNSRTALACAAPASGARGVACVGR